MIILLVLAAIVIVWQAVRGTVEKASTKVETQSACIGLDLSVTGNCAKTANTLSLSVTRGGDSIGNGTLKVSVASGSLTGNQESAGFEALAAKTFNSTDFGLTAIDTSVTVNVGLILTADNTACQGDTEVITCSA